MSKNKVNDSVLAMKMGRPRCVPVNEVSPKIITSAYRHGLMKNDTINDASLALSFAMHERSNKNGANYNFRSPSIYTVKMF